MTDLPLKISVHPWPLSPIIFPSEGDKSTCDSSESEDGSKCVWCTGLANVCVSEEYAQQIKQFGFDCDDDKKDDDDDDDDTPSKDDDDDVAPTDDTVPDNYWDCRTKYDSSDKCTGAGCVWCETKGGYEICMDDKTAETASDSYWYTCDKKNPASESSYDVLTTTLKELLAGADKGLSNPTDPSCLIVTLSQGDESTCKSTKDSDGKPCDWCSIQGTDLCLNADQAQIIEQYGGECGENDDVSVGATTMITSWR